MDALETVETIEAWSQPTFGPSPNLLVALSRANAELSELIMVCAQPTPDSEKIAIESADVAICMCRAAAILFVPIDEIFNGAERLSRFDYDSPLALALGANGHFAFLMARVLADDFDIDEAREYVEMIIKKLTRLCNSIGVNLGVVIVAKMKINRAREWRKTGEGIGQHVE